MGFKKVVDHVTDTEIELFEGVIDWISIKERAKPDNYGKTHTVSICVDSKDGKDGTWMFLPAIKEERIRQDGKAISVGVNKEWFEINKGCKVKLEIKRNGDFINAKVLKVLEVVSLEESKPQNNSVKKPYPVGAQVCHSRTAAADLCSRVEGLEFAEAMKAAHEATALVKVYVAKENPKWGEAEVGNESGNCVNTACKMVSKVEDLPKYCIAHHKQKGKWEEYVKAVNADLSKCEVFSYEDFGLENPNKQGSTSLQEGEYELEF